MGEAGQRRLREAHAAIVGVGALGCATAELLCRAGVGVLTLIDRDVVEWSNLQRQSLYDERDAQRGLPKAEAAAARLRAIDSAIDVRPAVLDVRADNAPTALGLDGSSAAAPRVLIDGTDNFATRLLLNDASVRFGVPYAYAGVVGTAWTQATFIPPGPCLRCLMPEAPAPGATATCDTLGVWGPAVAMVAAVQASDALRLLLGESLASALTSFDLLAMPPRMRRVWLEQDPRCACCAQRDFAHLEGRASDDIASLCGQHAVQVRPAGHAGLDLSSLEARWKLAEQGSPAALAIERSRFMLRRTLENGLRLSVFADGRAIVHGTTNPDTARAAYARYVGT